MTFGTGAKGPTIPSAPTISVFFRTAPLRAVQPLPHLSQTYPGRSASPLPLRVSSYMLPPPGRYFSADLTTSYPPSRLLAGLPHPTGTSSSFLAFPVTNTIFFPAREAAMASLGYLAVPPEAPLPRVTGTSGWRRKRMGGRPASGPGEDGMGSRYAPLAAMTAYTP